MKKISLPLILLFGASFQSLAINEKPQINKYSQTKNVESFELSNLQRSTLEAIIQNANSDKRIDAESENGLKDTFGDLSRKIAYTGTEILNINLKLGKTCSDNVSLKPTYLSYGSDLNLRSVEFESKNKNIKAKLYSFAKSNESDSPSELYYEIIINTHDNEKFIRLSKDLEVIKATETKQLKIPSVSGSDTIEVKEGLINQSLVAEPINSKSSVSKSINGWTVKMPLDPSASVENTIGPGVLWLIHPNIAGRLKTYKFRQYMPVPVLDSIGEIIEGEDIIDGSTLASMRYYTAHEKTEYGLRYAYSLPPEDVCPHGRCTDNYSQLLSKMANSQKLREMRKAWKADVVMFVHPFFDAVNQIAGKAYKPTRTGDRNNKHLAFAVAGWGYTTYANEYYAMHELFHLMGLGHSGHSSTQPGISPARAFIGKYTDNDQGKTVYGVRSFMAYDDVCKKTAKTDVCERYDHFSSTSRYVELSNGKKLKLGSSYDDNNFTAVKFIREVANYSKHL